MTYLLIFLFWCCLLMVLHSYVFYPLILSVVSGSKKHHDLQYRSSEELPDVWVVFAAYNEEAVIREKIESIFQTDYPLEKLHVFIGSDGSTDQTDPIVAELSSKHRQLHFYRYNDRAGKATVINNLMRDIAKVKTLSKDEVLIYTDANIIFEKHTIFDMVKHFKDPLIGQVGANVQNKGVNREGISRQEQFYVSRENQIKHMEGKTWGAMMGAFGACYALRANLYPSIPSNFLMEDFYISMHVLEEDHLAILEPSATCWEDLPNEVEEEFKRKIRISAGNFQNLSVYYPMLWPPFNGKAFAFLSHKVLRWITPFLLLIMLVSSAILAIDNHWYKLLLGAQLLLIMTPLLDKVLRRIHLHSLLLRFVSYFYAMNAALFLGFIKYMKGVKTSVWQPTKRNVHETE